MTGISGMSAGTGGSVEEYAGAGGNPSGAGDTTAPAALAATDKPAVCAAAGKGSSST
ncbi:hypothetical protein [Streptomyces sp. NPDC087787]|uniref:hypothetical protein n=1 Tax=Streptomyces sp. NPDC087787 TaxID=3365803 RepID=UPI003815D181